MIDVYDLPEDRKKYIQNGIAINQSWGNGYFVKVDRENKKLYQEKEFGLNFNKNKLHKIVDRPYHFYDNMEDCCVWLVSNVEWDDLHICECCGHKN